MKPKPTAQQKFTLELATFRGKSWPQRACTESWWAKPWPNRESFNAAHAAQQPRWSFSSTEAKPSERSAR